MHSQRDKWYGADNLRRSNADRKAGLGRGSGMARLEWIHRDGQFQMERQRGKRQVFWCSIYRRKIAAKGSRPGEECALK